MADKGRPPKFKKLFIEQAYVASCEGLTDKKLAKLFGIVESTLNEWKLKYPDFSESLKKGKDEFNCQVAENCLLKRIKGFSYNETTREPVHDPDAGETKMTVTKKVRKHVPSDPISIFFFLKNRDPQRWRDKSELHVDGFDKLGERLARAIQRGNDDTSGG